jgi:hypothetical protein
MRNTESSQLAFIHKSVKRTMHHPCEIPLCRLHILHQHNIIAGSPDGGQKSDIHPQLPSGMGRSKIAQVGSKSKIVLGVKYMQRHSFQLQNYYKKTI